MYVIFAWRSHGIHGDQPEMPDDSAQQALANLAQRYRGKPNVMYALQVEPHDVTWSQLQPRYVQMVDAIRTASAPYKPIIMVPGTDWSRDVSGAITSPVRRENVVYKSHPYNNQSQFQHAHRHPNRAVRLEGPVARNRNHLDRRRSTDRGGLLRGNTTRQRHDLHQPAAFHQRSHGHPHRNRKPRSHGYGRDHRPGHGEQLVSRLSSWRRDRR
jgi:hypothetical protein